MPCCVCRSRSFYIYNTDEPIESELLAFLRVFNMAEGSLFPELDPRTGESFGTFTIESGNSTCEAQLCARVPLPSSPFLI